MGLAEALDGDGGLGHAVLDQFRGHSLGTPHGQALVVVRGAGGVGVAVDFNPRVLNLGGVRRRFGDDLTRAIGQVALSQSKNTR